MRELKKRIVVVDDDAGMNQAIQRLLSAAGFRVVTFPSAEALLQDGAAESAACLVLDIHLPGLSGLELCRQLQQGGNNTPIVFITAYDDPSSEAQAHSVGAAGYFTKPFQGQSLLTAIAKATGAEPEEDLTFP